MEIMLCAACKQTHCIRPTLIEIFPLERDGFECNSYAKLRINLGY